MPHCRPYIVYINVQAAFFQKIFQIIFDNDAQLVILDPAQVAPSQGLA